MRYFRQPDYYQSFRCMGGKCPNTCCARWSIDWSIDEIEKLKAEDCSPELRKLIEENFIEKENCETMKKVKLTDDTHECPFLTEDRMCRIQRELGEEYLSYTCTIYPRTSFYCNDVIHRACSSSCYEVIKTLYLDKNAMNLCNAPTEKETKKIICTVDQPLQLKKHPELKYRNELFEFFYEIISNKKRTLETSLVLGALAAQKLTEYINCGEHDRIPEVIKALRPQLNAQTVPAFEKVKPNFGLCLGLTGELVNTFQDSTTLECLKLDGKLSVEKYEEGRAIFTAFTDRNPHWLRNLALNFLFEGKVPFMDIEKTLFENYCYYASTIAALKTIGAAFSFKNKSVIVGLVVAFTVFIRGMYHSPKITAPKIYDILKRNDINSPAKIALILK